jgi:hypothetical protein
MVYTSDRKREERVMKNRAVVWAAILVIGGIASYFTVSKGDVASWNDKVVARYNKFAMAWMSFQPSFAPYLKGQKIDEAGLEASFKKYEKDVARASDELRGFTPPDEEVCRQFHAEVVSYADLQIVQLAEVRKLVNTMKASNPGKPADISGVTEAFNELGVKESAKQDIIQARQKSMAQKFKLKIK